MYDTTKSFAAAADLRDAAEQLTNRPATLVFNSHYHKDDIWGNQVFETADVIATAETRRLIEIKAPRSTPSICESACRGLLR